MLGLLLGTTGDLANMSLRKNQEVADLKKQFEKEIDTVRSYAKIVMSFAAGLRDGQRICQEQERQQQQGQKPSDKPD